MEERHVGKEIRVLSNLIHRKINQMVMDEEDTLTGHQNWVLGYLIQNQDRDIMQRDIEKQFSIRRSTVSHMLQLMEKNGYIKRQSSETDARMKKILITDRGLEAYGRMQDRLDRFERMLQDHISEEELKIFLQILKRMEDNID